MPFDSLNLCGCKIEEAQLNLLSSMATGHVRSASSSAYDHVIIVRTNSKRCDTYLSFETAKQKVNVFVPYLFLWFCLVYSIVLVTNAAISDLVLGGEKIYFGYL